MKTRIVAFLSFALLAASASATKFTVMQTGGGNFTSIQSCASAMAAGDTCTVYAGTYNENVAVPAGGVGAYKTLQANPGDTVNVQSFTLNSHTKIIGFHIQNPSSPGTTRCVTITANSPQTDIYVTGNDLYACGFGFSMLTTGSSSSNFATYVYVQYNTFSYGCSTSSAPDVCKPIFVRGDHWLVEGNDFSHVNTPITIQAGSYNVIRNNTAHDIYSRDPNNLYPAMGITPECIPSLNTPPSVSISGTTVTWSAGSQFGDEYPGAWVKIGGTKYMIATVNYTTNQSMTLTSAPGDGATTLTGGNGGNCHSDFFATAPAFPSRHNLVEGNVVYHLPGHDSKAVLSQADACAGECSDLIIRLNVMVHIGSSGILDNFGAFYNVRSYNNDWVDFSSYPGNQSGGVTNVFTRGSTGGANINDLFFYAQSLGNYNPYVCDDKISGNSTCSSFTARNNLAWCLGADLGGNCNLHGQIAGSGNFTDGLGNIKANPQFVDYSSSGMGNLSLQPNSPLHSAGSYLTTVAAADPGSGTSLLVNDAGFFQDGYSIAGVKADQIRLGTATVAQISSINFGTNTLNLSSSVTRSPGDPVYLFSDSKGRVVLFGNAPDIGALPAGLQQTPAPPSALTVTVT